MYVRSNIEALSYIHCGSGRAMIITQAVFTFLALGIHHAIDMCHNFICGLLLSTIFFHILS